MKYISKDQYGPWDSPHTFCRYQVEDKDYCFSCTEKILDFVEATMSDQEAEKSSKCCFKESDIKNGKIKGCKNFEFHKNDKNPKAKRMRN